MDAALPGGALAACLLGAGLLAAMETALVGLPSPRVHAAIDGTPTPVPRARRLLYWLRYSARILATLHVARSVLLLAAAFDGARLAAALGLRSPVLWTVPVVAVASLAVSHLVPRSLAKRYPMAIAIHGILPTLALTALLAPVVWPLAQLGRLLGRLLGATPEHPGPFWTPDEISRLTADAHAQSLGGRGGDLFLSIIEFSDTVIREIMVPRTEMVVVSATASPAELQQVLLEGRHSRVPVYEETIDNVAGILHVKDLFVATLGPAPRLLADLTPTALRAMLRPAFYVPEVMKISELLREFQRRKTHLAVVVDEYGGTAGVVTLEDIIEEIVGEIQDEYDVEEKQFRTLGDKIVADGRVSIWDLEAALGLEFPDDGDYETLAGFLTAHTGSLPERGSVITWHGLRFTVKEANPKRIGTVEIERIKAS